jgi:hypothetical protein
MSHASLAVELAPIDRALAQAAREVRLLGAVTPLDAAKERARLAAAAEAGGAIVPRWSYPPQDRRRVRLGLDELVRVLLPLSGLPLAALFLARARELAEEAALVDAIGSDGFGAMATLRYAPPDAGSASEVVDTVRDWLALAPDTDAPVFGSDDKNPRSLLERMRAEVGRLRLPFAVVATDSLAALAAIGDETIWVATGRQVTESDVERTIMHELHGHALPRVRAARMPIRLFATGTARGEDDQEGFALVLEERGGFLGARRKRELAARHHVVTRMTAGATFADAVHALTSVSFSARDAVRIAERAYRGGNGKGAGLGRERVYLDALVRVRAHLEAHPTDEKVLASGQVALNAVDALRSMASA